MRCRFCFWLDANKDDELLMMEDIDTLKRDRLFVSTIRDGIRLILDLRQGRADVLRELFPDVVAMLTTTQKPDDDDDLAQKVERLETLILQQGHAPLVAKEKPAESEPIHFEIKKDTKTNSAQNFLDSIMNLQQ